MMMWGPRPQRPTRRTSEDKARTSVKEIGRGPDPTWQDLEKQNHQQIT